jgi:hypothetical protein
VGHQDNDLELRALLAELSRAETAEQLVADAPPVPEDLIATPLALDHDDVPSWRQTARFFRNAA